MRNLLIPFVCSPYSSSMDYVKPHISIPVFLGRPMNLFSLARYFIVCFGVLSSGILSMCNVSFFLKFITFYVIGSIFNSFLMSSLLRRSCPIWPLSENALLLPVISFHPSSSLSTSLWRTARQVELERSKTQLRFLSCFSFRCSANCSANSLKSFNFLLYIQVYVMSHITA
jgi:hypothetical protein